MYFVINIEYLMHITDGHFVDMMEYENTKHDIPQVLVTEHGIKCKMLLFLNAQVGLAGRGGSLLLPSWQNTSHYTLLAQENVKIVRLVPTECLFCLHNCIAGKSDVECPL